MVLCLAVEAQEGFQAEFYDFPLCGRARRGHCGNHQFIIYEDVGAHVYDSVSQYT